MENRMSRVPSDKVLHAAQKLLSSDACGHDVSLSDVVSLQNTSSKASTRVKHGPSDAATVLDRNRHALSETETQR
jgi:hypothetical protein